MNIDELFDVLEYAIKHYIALDGVKFGVMEYYSLTDISPRELSKIALPKRGKQFTVLLGMFAENNYWHLNKLNVGSKLKLFHSVHDYELTEEDKLTIISKIQEEGYPLVEGIFDKSARLFVTKGVEAISKEYIRKEILNDYNLSVYGSQDSNTLGVFSKQL